MCGCTQLDGYLDKGFTPGFLWSKPTSSVVQYSGNVWVGAAWCGVAWRGVARRDAVVWCYVVAWRGVARRGANQTFPL